MPVFSSDPFGVHRLNSRGEVRRRPSSTAETEGEAKRLCRRLQHATGAVHVVRPNPMPDPKQKGHR